MEDPLTPSDNMFCCGELSYYICHTKFKTTPIDVMINGHDATVVSNVVPFIYHFNDKYSFDRQVILKHFPFEI